MRLETSEGLQKLFSALSHSPAKYGMKVAGAMEHTHQFNGVFSSTIKDQIISNGKTAQTLPEIFPHCSHARITRVEFKFFIESA